MQEFHDRGPLDAAGIWSTTRCPFCAVRMASSIATELNPCGTTNSAAPIVGLELMNGNDPNEQAWGLAGMEPQGSGQKIAFPHYAATSRWWTRLTLLNLGTGNADVSTAAFGNDGQYAGGSHIWLLPRTLIGTDVKSLLGVE